MEAIKRAAKNKNEKKEGEYMAKAVLLKVSESKDAEVVTLPKTLKGLKKLLEVETIDIVRRSINGKYYHVICDDEGLLKPNPVLSGVGFFGRPEFFGNLLICSGRYTGDGDLVGLSAKQIENVLDGVKKIKDHYVLLSVI